MEAGEEGKDEEVLVLVDELAGCVGRPASTPSLRVQPGGLAHLHPDDGC